MMHVRECSRVVSDISPIHHHPILSLLEAAAERQQPINIRTLHAYTITSGLIRDTFAASRIVDFLLKAGGPDRRRYADDVFSSIHQPDVYTWNAMIASHADDFSSSSSSITYYFQMLSRQGPPPNNYTFALLVKAACKDSIWVGRKVHGQILKQGAEDFLVVRNTLINMYCNMAHMEEAQLLFDKSLENLDLISWNSMISGYGKAGCVESARCLFDEMPQRNLVSWTAMIDSYVRNGHFLEALQQFNAMQASGMKPDVVTLVSILKACAHLGALYQGRWIHIYTERNKLGNGRNVVLLTALIDMYAKCGCIDAALGVFHGAHVRDVVLWNAMIGGLSMHGHGHDALEFFSRMKGSGVAPNEVTFLSVLCACTHAGMVKEGMGIFNSMNKDYGIEPRREHYGCLADLLGRAGKMREAEEVLINMPMVPQASQWGALMSACRTHNDLELGERIGKHLLTLEPDDGGRYVLLSNVYAGAGRWGDALKSRRKMEEKGIKKERGCSFIEWNGVVHEFAVGDTSHPRSRDIKAMVDEIERRLKMMGYIHDTSQMLLDMCDEEEKEMALSSHSERLAIAFGIMNVPHGTSIRIVKNLRVCRDCHTYTKLVSKAYQKEIVVRDRNRFHRFRDGFCSCMDYW